MSWCTATASQDLNGPFTSARRRRDAGDDLDEAIASAQGVLEFALSEFLLLPEAKPARRLALRYPPWHTLAGCTNGIPSPPLSDGVCGSALIVMEA